MNIENYKTKLEEEKKILEEELGSIGQADKTGDWKAVPESKMLNQEVQDEADLADRAENFEERSSLLDTLELRLKDVNGALQEMVDEVYGKCDACDAEIEKDRLEANAAAHTCKACMGK